MSSREIFDLSYSHHLFDLSSLLSCLCIVMSFLWKNLTTTDYLFPPPRFTFTKVFYWRMQPLLAVIIQWSNRSICIFMCTTSLQSMQEELEVCSTPCLHIWIFLQLGQAVHSINHVPNTLSNKTGAICFSATFAYGIKGDTKYGSNRTIALRREEEIYELVRVTR